MAPLILLAMNKKTDITKFIPAYNFITLHASNISAMLHKIWNRSFKGEVI
jgi:hypothetical protein